MGSYIYTQKQFIHPLPFLNIKPFKYIGYHGKHKPRKTIFFKQI